LQPAAPEEKADSETFGGSKSGPYQGTIHSREEKENPAKFAFAGKSGQGEQVSAWFKTLA
jgi:hypothetical protein